MFKKIKKPAKAVRSYYKNSVREYYQSEGHERIYTISLVLVSLSFVLLLVYQLFIKPPSDFPAGVLIKIEEGQTVNDVAGLLKERSVIQSPFLFKFLVSMEGEGTVLSGEYFFNIQETVLGISSRLAHGLYGLDPVRITIPEGVDVFQIAEILDSKLPSFDEAQFLRLAISKEGYLFPDTYSFLPNVSPISVIEDMSDNFDKKIEELSEEIEGSDKTLEEIIIMASILEKETITERDKRIVSGVLWTRIEIGMPLQVDAPFKYINGKNTYQLTLDDLQIDSPYNTYKNTGLPPGPIANPGKEAILAAINPIETDYLFFLSDRQGQMHYAEDFEGHKRNRELYLDK